LIHWAGRLLSGCGYELQAKDFTMRDPIAA
jgi:hypothetical protein